MTTSAVELVGIGKRFPGVIANHDVNLTIAPSTVHALVGENGAGKSTLMKILYGVQKPDSGTITVNGEVVEFSSPSDAIAHGIGMVFQHFQLADNFTVLENIVLGAEKLHGTGAAARQAVLEISERFGFDLDPDVLVETLGVAARQRLEILKVLYRGARIIILDEPTAVLVPQEVEALFANLEGLKAEGHTILFISHKLDEVLAISDRVTVLRSGMHVITRPAAELDLRSITEHMTGLQVDDSRQVSELAPDAPAVLEVEGLTLPGAFHDVSFTLRRGEILGLTGLLGSGRTEIAESLFGVHPYESGSVIVDGTPTAVRSIDDAVAAGIGYVPEDRLTQGLFLEHSIADNMIASSADRLRTPWRTLDRSAIRTTIDTLFTRLRVKAPNVDAPVRSLSGGNAQRVVLAKWLARQPKVLILNGPTVGVDVGSKSEILDILRDQAADGMGVMVISDDVPELVSSCHRVLVVRHGRIVDVLEGDDVEVDSIRKKVAA